MKQFLVILTFTILIISSLNAQDEAEILPDWFFNPAYHSSPAYGIGISDPHLDSTAAIQQAVVRAYLMNSLLHGGQFNSLVTYGLGNEQKAETKMKSLETILFSAIILDEIPFAPKLKPEQVFETHNREIMVLLKMPTDTSKIEHAMQIELIKRTGFERADNKMPISLDEIEFLIKVDDRTVAYSHIQKLRTGYNYFSAAGKPSIKYKMNSKRHLTYNLEETVCENNRVLRSKMNSGIWLAYLVNIMDQVSIYSSFESVSTKDLTSSNIGNWTFEDKAKSMSNLFYTGKTFTKFNTNYKIEHIQTQENELCLAMENPIRLTDLESIRGSAKELSREMKDYAIIGYEKVEEALEKLASYQLSGEYTIITVNTKASNLNSGIVKATNLAKFQLRSQTSSDVKGLSKSDINNDYSVVINSNKTMGEQEITDLANYFVLYRKMDNGFYSIETIMVYR